MTKGEMAVFAASFVTGLCRRTNTNSNDARALILAVGTAATDVSLLRLAEKYVPEDSFEGKLLREMLE